MEQLQALYEAYQAAMEKAISQASPFAGAFNMGEDPRNHPCNTTFYEGVEQWAAQFAAGNPGAQEAEWAVRWMVEYPAAHRGSSTYWYAYAVQKHAMGLVQFLTPAQAGALAQRMRDCYPRKEDWLPVQTALAKQLAQRAGTVQHRKQSLLDLWGRRVALLLVGLTIAHLGVTLFLLAELGSDPFNVLIQGLHRITGLASHGTIHVGVCFGIILVLLAVDRSYVRIGTFLCMLLGGPIIDGFTWLLGSLIGAGSPMAVRIAAVVLGCGILAFGMTMVIQSQAGTGPNDLVAVVISDKGKWKFGVVRIAVDVAFAAIGFALGGTVGLGTIICVAVVGPVAQFFLPLSRRICGRVLGEKNGISAAAEKGC